MGRLVMAGAFVAAALGIVHAGPTRKVQVESDPEGASVYIDAIESGVACEPTPCTIDAPLGSPVIIVRKDGFEAELSQVEVTKGKRPLQQKFKLKSAIGTIKVDAPKGATVRVNNEDKGKAPIEIPAPAGPHHVVIVAGGKTVHDEVVEVVSNEEKLIQLRTAGADDDTSVTDDPEDGEDGSGGGSGGAATGTGSVGISKGTTTPRLRPPLIHLGLAFDVGFRSFTYDRAMTSNLRNEVEGGQVIAGPAVELWPGRLLGVKPLRGLSVFVRYEHPIVGKTVTGMLMGSVTTRWQSFEASLRHRWLFSSIGVEASGGYVEDNLSFTFTDARDRDQLPVANYQSMRIGLKLAYVADNLEPYISAENRIVLSGGLLGTRFDAASAAGMRGSAGIAIRMGALVARIEGTLMSYSWKLNYDGQNDIGQAKGATDSIKLISTLVGYAF